MIKRSLLLLILALTLSACFVTDYGTEDYLTRITYHVGCPNGLDVDIRNHYDETVHANITVGTDTRNTNISPGATKTFKFNRTTKTKSHIIITEQAGYKTNYKFSYKFCEQPQVIHPL